MEPAMKILTTPRMERCIGCNSCSLACARLVHKRLSWLAAGIRIMSTGGLSTGFEARSCMACDPAPCAEAYKKAVGHLGIGANDFYRLLGMGTSKAAEHYGGSDYACVLGQEMAGYATGEVFYTAQSLGFRHSHLDSGGYSYDQKHDEKDVQKAVDFLIADEQDRVLLTSMVSCLFAREVYTKAHLTECLNSVGYLDIADNMESIKKQIQKKRWQLRLATGFKPEKVTIPKRFTELTTWKGKTDVNYLNALKSAYAEKINEIGVSKDRDE